MGKFTRGKPKDSLAFVTVNDILYYGFSIRDAAAIPGVSAADLTACGHLTSAGVADNSVKILVFSPNSPKPATYTKRLANPAGQQQSFSTFVGHAAKLTALSAGFKPSRAARKVNLRSAPRSGGSQVTAIAQMENGLLYCWSMDATDFGEVKADLGLMAASEVTTDAERKVLVVGPGAGCRPGRAEKETATGSISSFYSFGTTLPAGWNQKSEESLGIDIFSGT